MSFLNKQAKRAATQAAKLLKAEEIIKKCNAVIKFLDSKTYDKNLVEFRKKAAELIENLNAAIMNGLKNKYPEEKENYTSAKIQTSDRYLLKVHPYLNSIRYAVQLNKNVPCAPEIADSHETNVRYLLKVRRPISRIALLNIDDKGKTVYKELTKLFKKLKNKSVINKLLLEEPTPPPKRMPTN